MTDLLTVAEFAKTLGVSPRTILREINDGALPYVPVRLDPARRAKAMAIGDGNVAKGVRAALDAFQTASLPDTPCDE